MRAFVTAIIIFFSIPSYSDYFEIVEDLNYEVDDSDSQNHIERFRNSIAIDNKVYFDVKVDAGWAEGSTSVRLTERRLAVSDGTSNGTYLVKGLENIDLSGVLHTFIEVNGKLVLFLRNPDARNTSIWEVNVDNDIAAKVAEFSSTAGYPSFNNPLLAYHYGSEKVVITSYQSDSVAIYDSNNSTVYNISMKDITGLAKHEASRFNFVLGDYFYYQTSVSASSKETYRLDLVKQEVEFVDSSGIGESHKIINDKVYFIQKNSDNKYQLLSRTNVLGSTKIEYDSLAYTSSPESKIHVKDDFIIYNNADSLVVKQKIEPSFKKIELPENVSITGSPLDLDKNIIAYGDKYYIPGYRRGNPSELVLLKTDLSTYIESVYEGSFVDLEQREHIEYFVVKNNNLYAITGTNESPVGSTGYGKTAAYLWNSDNSSFNQVWSIDNFNDTSLVNHDKKEIVFGYTIDNGSEPWHLDVAAGTKVLLADLNTSPVTKDVGTFVKRFQTKTRLIFSFSQLAYRPVESVYSLFDGLITEYLKPANDSNIEQRTLVGIDKRYDYYLGTETYPDKLPRFVIKAYDHESSSIVELDSFSANGLKSKSGSELHNLHKGRISFIKQNFDSEQILDSQELYQWGVDGSLLSDIEDIYTEVIEGPDFLLLTGWNEEDSRQEFGVFKNGKVIATFSITCEWVGPCSNRYREVLVKGDTVLVASDAISSDLGDFRQLHKFNVIRDTTAVEIRNTLFENQRIPRPIPIYAVSDNSLLILRNTPDYRKVISRYDLGNKTLTEYDLDEQVVGHTPAQVAEILKEVGNYYVGLFDNKIAVFDKTLRLVKSKNITDIYNQLGYDLSLVSNGNYLECAYGYCYIQNRTGDTSDPRGQYFLLKFDITLNDFSAEYFNLELFNSVWSSKNTIYAKGRTPLYGFELYQYTVEGSDIDGDGLWDAYELAYDFDPNDSADGALDFDGDGLSNYEEFEFGTNPINAHTDNDGLADGIEVNLSFNPMEYDTHLYDTDEDGFSYRQEMLAGTDYSNPDTDGDGVKDSIDLFPLDETESTDFDQDGIGDNADIDDDNDGVEDTEDAFPNNRNEWADNDLDDIGDNADTDDDNDLMPDDWELQYGLDPLSGEDRDLDPDNDGRTNYQEYLDGTNPTVSNKDNSDGGSPDNDSGGSGGGGSTPIWLLTVLLLTLTARRYYK